MLRQRLRRAQVDNRTAIALPKALLACLCSGMIAGALLPMGVDAQKKESSSADCPPHLEAHAHSCIEDTEHLRPAGEDR